MSLHSTLQLPDVGEEIPLFRLDATRSGGQVYFFTPATKTADGLVFTGVTFGGQYYTPMDVAFTDMSVNGTGALPTPKMQLSNTNEVIQGVVNAYGDLQGCEIRRVRTFKRFLDGEAEADPTAFIGPDVFQIERKSSDVPTFIEWELSAAIDQEGKMLPGQVVIRDTCTFRYRSWDSAAQQHVYSDINPCPYAGTSYFDVNGSPTTIDKDACSRHLNTGCFKRYARSGPVPFGGFPGAARVRLS